MARSDTRSRIPSTNVHESDVMIGDLPHLEDEETNEHSTILHVTTIIKDFEYVEGSADVFGFAKQFGRTEKMVTVGNNRIKFVKIPAHEYVFREDKETDTMYNVTRGTYVKNGRMYVKDHKVTTWCECERSDEHHIIWYSDHPDLDFEPSRDEVNLFNINHLPTHLFKRGDVIVHKLFGKCEDTGNVQYRNKCMKIFDGVNVIPLSTRYIEDGHLPEQFLLFTEFPPDYFCHLGYDIIDHIRIVDIKDELIKNLVVVGDSIVTHAVVNGHKVNLITSLNKHLYTENAEEGIKMIKEYILNNDLVSVEKYDVYYTKEYEVITNSGENIDDYMVMSCIYRSWL